MQLTCMNKVSIKIKNQRIIEIVKNLNGFKYA